jgi:hypothetical protein
MQVKCEYCGGMVDDTQSVCPHCGATNTNMKRTVDHTPKTIEELKQWYQDRHLPPYETTRFFIGIDYQYPRAFGIYRDGNEVVVYKNKDDGSRAIRYRGTDEAYAVNELLMKLKSEILNQKAHNSTRNRNYSNTIERSLSNMVKSALISYGLLAMIFVVIIVVVIAIPGKTATYYRYDNTIYCKYDDDYYEYSYTQKDYVPISDESSLPKVILYENSDYIFDSDDVEWNSDYSFTDSDYYDDHFSRSYSSDSDDDKDYDSGSSYDSRSDSDYDWDSGSSWDSGGSDWSSDW